MTDTTEGHAERQPIGQAEAAHKLGEMFKSSQPEAKEPKAEPKAEQPEVTTETPADEDDFDPLKVDDLAEPDVEETEESDAEEPEIDPDDQEIEWETRDGTKIKTTLRELKRGHLREDDYTRKTQALSQEREALAKAQEEARKERTEQLQAVEVLIQKATENLRGNAKEPDESLLDPNSDQYNPDEYTRQKAGYDRAQQRVQDLYQEAANIRYQAMVDHTKQIDEYAGKQKERLEGLIPELKDGRKRTKIMGVIEAELKSQGWTDQQIRGVRDQNGLIRQPGILDAGIFHMAYNSARMKAWESGRKKVRQKVKSAPPIKSGTPKSRRENRQEAQRDVVNQARATGRREDAAKAIDAILKGRG